MPHVLVRKGVINKSSQTCDKNKTRDGDDAEMKEEKNVSVGTG